MDVEVSLELFAGAEESDVELGRFVGVFVGTLLAVVDDRGGM